MKNFREALGQFRDAVHEEAAQCPIPSALSYDRASKARLRWAAAVIVAIILGAIPFYENARQRQRAAEQAIADELLMEQVNDSLSRSVPLALAPLAGYSNKD